MPPARLYTLGYQGRDLDGVVALLREHGVGTLVDVRLNASSRAPGFSKRRLEAGLAAAGIGYRHRPELGNPRDNRAAFRRGDAAAHDRFRARLAEPEAAGALDELAELAASADLAGGVALLCFEADPIECHRRHVAAALAARSPGLVVVDL
ncbi:MAG: DUF488 domain-containing protein [Acidimicrobiia bacterium]|nr:DUF488 domain-containing protein [Acidimicrobiia bacterium]